MKIAHKLHELHEEKKHKFNRRDLIYQTQYGNRPEIGLDKSSYNEWIKKVAIFHRLWVRLLSIMIDCPQIKKGLGMRNQAAPLTFVWIAFKI